MTKRELKLEMYDPTGVVYRTYTMPYETDAYNRPLLTIGEHKYWIKENGGLLIKL